MTSVELRASVFACALAVLGVFGCGGGGAKVDPSVATMRTVAIIQYAAPDVADDSEARVALLDANVRALATTLDGKRFACARPDDVVWRESYSGAGAEWLRDLSTPKGFRLFSEPEGVRQALVPAKACAPLAAATEADLLLAVFEEPQSPLVGKTRVRLKAYDKSGRAVWQDEVAGMSPDGGGPGADRKAFRHAVERLVSRLDAALAR